MKKKVFNFIKNSTLLFVLGLAVMASAVTFLLPKNNNGAISQTATSVQASQLNVDGSALPEANTVPTNTNVWAQSSTAPTLEGEGTEASPYLINSEQNFIDLSKHFATKSGSTIYYKLTTNLDFEGRYINPVFTTALSSKFIHFDGAGFTISGAHISSKKVNMTISLFGSISRSTIINLNVTDCVFENLGTNSTTSNVATIASSTGGITVDNVHVTNSIIKAEFTENSSTSGITIASGLVYIFNFNKLQNIITNNSVTNSVIYAGALNETDYLQTNYLSQNLNLSKKGVAATAAGVVTIESTSDKGNTISNNIVTNTVVKAISSRTNGMVAGVVVDKSSNQGAYNAEQELGTETTNAINVFDNYVENSLVLGHGNANGSNYPAIAVAGIAARSNTTGFMNVYGGEVKNSSVLATSNVAEVTAAGIAANVNITSNSSGAGNIFGAIISNSYLSSSYVSAIYDVYSGTGSFSAFAAGIAAQDFAFIKDCFTSVGSEVYVYNKTYQAMAAGIGFTDVMVESAGGAWHARQTDITENESKFENCYNYATVTALTKDTNNASNSESAHASGIGIGEKFNNNFNYGDINGVLAGGITSGFEIHYDYSNYSYPMSITNCLNAGTITDAKESDKISFIGGIMGRYYSIHKDNYDLVLENNVSIGKIMRADGSQTVTTATYMGALFGLININESVTSSANTALQNNVRISIKGNKLLAGPGSINEDLMPDITGVTASRVWQNGQFTAVMNNLLNYHTESMYGTIYMSTSSSLMPTALNIIFTSDVSEMELTAGGEAYSNTFLTGSESAEELNNIYNNSNFVGTDSWSTFIPSADGTVESGQPSVLDNIHTANFSFENINDMFGAELESIIITTRDKNASDEFELNAPTYNLALLTSKIQTLFWTADKEGLTTRINAGDLIQTSNSVSTYYAQVTNPIYNIQTEGALSYTDGGTNSTYISGENANQVLSITMGANGDNVGLYVKNGNSSTYILIDSKLSNGSDAVVFNLDTYLKKGANGYTTGASIENYADSSNTLTFEARLIGGEKFVINFATSAQAGYSNNYTIAVEGGGYNTENAGQQISVFYESYVKLTALANTHYEFSHFNIIYGIDTTSDGVADTLRTINNVANGYIVDGNALAESGTLVDFVVTVFVTEKNYQMNVKFVNQNQAEFNAEDSSNLEITSLPNVSVSRTNYEVTATTNNNYRFLGWQLLDGTVVSGADNNVIDLSDITNLLEFVEVVDGQEQVTIVAQYIKQYEVSLTLNNPSYEGQTEEFNQNFYSTLNVTYVGNGQTETTTVSNYVQEQIVISTDEHGNEITEWITVYKNTIAIRLDEGKKVSIEILPNKKVSLANFISNAEHSVIHSGLETGVWLSEDVSITYTFEVRDISINYSAIVKDTDATKITEDNPFGISEQEKDLGQEVFTSVITKSNLNTALDTNALHYLDTLAVSINQENLSRLEYRGLDIYLQRLDGTLVELTSDILIDNDFYQNFVLEDGTINLYLKAVKQYKVDVTDTSVHDDNYQLGSYTVLFSVSDTSAVTTLEANKSYMVDVGVVANITVTASDYCKFDNFYGLADVDSNANGQATIQVNESKNISLNFIKNVYTLKVEFDAVIEGKQDYTKEFSLNDLVTISFTPNETHVVKEWMVKNNIVTAEQITLNGNNMSFVATKEVLDNMQNIMQANVVNLGVTVSTEMNPTLLTGLIGGGVFAVIAVILVVLLVIKSNKTKKMKEEHEAKINALSRKFNIADEIKELRK